MKKTMADQAGGTAFSISHQPSVLNLKTHPLNTYYHREENTHP